MSTVLITGTSSGFGHLTARTLATAGHTVFASMRNSTRQNADRAEALREHAETVAGSITVLDLDVTDDTSVDAAVAAASKDGPIDVVINN
ncbi:MAG: SDR family NAD(P)-dependent oxidoreductase, partial [Myxococcales bacterium]|nr:SDR family NAD(P)-dependent oxidoreductase [Myxococcales bacterium]